MSNIGGAIVASRSMCASFSSPASFANGAVSGSGPAGGSTSVAVERVVFGTSGVARIGGSLGRGRRGGTFGRGLLGNGVDQIGHREHADRDRLVRVVHDD